MCVFPFQVDQAVVSLVDKDRIRAEIAEVTAIIKAWSKSLSATRTTFALSEIERLAETALQNSQVGW